MKKGISIIASLLCLALMISCGGGKSSYRDIMKKPEKLFYQGKYKQAADLLKPWADKGDNNELLYMMEAGYMFHAAQNIKLSTRILRAAAKIAEVQPISVSRQAASFLTSDKNTNYRGEDFEKVLVHMYLGLNYLRAREFDSARVEFKSVNNELAKIKNEDGSARYKQNLMAKYLTAVAMEAVAQVEDDKEDLEYAYVEYKQLHQLDPNNQLVKRDLIRVAKKLEYMDDYADWRAKFGALDAGTYNRGEVIVVFEAGQCAIKASRGRLLSDKGMRVSINVALNTTSLAAGMTAASVIYALRKAENPIPKFVPRSNRTRLVRVIAPGGFQNTLMLENIEDTAVQNLKDDYGRLKKRLAISIVSKAVASYAAGAVSKGIAKQFMGDAGANLVGLAAGVGTGAALFSQMGPDLRCWHTLPANLQLARLFLPPGKQWVTLQFVGFNGQIQKVKKINVDIKKGEKIVINERTLF